MIDEHLHLVPHGSNGRFSAETVRGHTRAAAEAGLRAVAFTEHLFRFPDVQDALGAWWEDDPDPRLRDHMAAYQAAERLEQPLAEYVDVVLGEAARAGDVTVRLGLEVDLFAGRMAEVVDLLAAHRWDVLLGAVHWLGAWGFDQWDDPFVQEEWGRRRAEDVWLAYVAAVEEVAASGACDVLAHLDLPKGDGVRPGAVAEEVDERLAKAAAANGLAVEVSTAGWRKPVGEAYPAPPLLARLRASGVGVTLASDAHTASTVGDRIGDAAALAGEAGYTEVLLFEQRAATGLSIVQWTGTERAG